MDLSLTESCISFQCFLPNLKSIDINSVFGLVVVLKLVHIHVHCTWSSFLKQYLLMIGAMLKCKEYGFFFFQFFSGITSPDVKSLVED